MYLNLPQKGITNVLLLSDIILLPNERRSTEKSNLHITRVSASGNNVWPSSDFTT